MHRHALMRGTFAFGFLSLVSLFSLSLLPLFSSAATAHTPLILSYSTACVDGSPVTELRWNNPNGAKNFTLHRSPNAFGATSWGFLEKGNSVFLSHTDQSVKASGVYKYQIQAIGGTQANRYSDVVTVTIPTCTESQPTTTVAPWEPLIVEHSVQCVNEKARVSLHWNNPNSAQEMTLFRNPNAAGAPSWGALKSADGTFVSYVDTSETGLTSHAYQVQALNGDQPVRYADILNVQIPNCASKITQENTTMTPEPQPVTSAPVAKELSWGVYPGWEDSKITEFESKVGNPDMLASFVHWGNSNQFPTYLAPYAKDKGRTLVIFWEASDHVLGGTIQTEFSYDVILSGYWDWYIRKFAQEARAYESEVILIPFSEMNGNWSPWGGTVNGNTPAKAAAAYRHVRTVFGDVPNVKFGWAPNSNSVPDTAENAIEKYYPGDAYVDYVGVDGFNFGNPWMTFDQIFSKPLEILEQYNKPIYIFSFASMEGPNKDDWMRDAFFTQMPKYPSLAGWIWFSQNKERDWRVWSDNSSLQVFKEAIN